jgi:hypothetical protein
MADIMYSADPGLIIGFHGCDKDVCDAIVSGQKQMDISNNVYDWLGDGLYFWQNNYERALHYAKNPPGRRKIKEPAVLGAVFSLGNCLDLTDKKSLDIVKIVYDMYRISMDAASKVMPQNIAPKGVSNPKDKVLRQLDCAVIKEVHKIFHQTGQKPFDTVRALLPEGNELYPGAGFLDQTHVQIAIRNPNMIKSFFYPRTAQNWNGKPVPFPKKAPSAPTK